MPAYLHGLGACGLKWVGGFVKNRQFALRNVTGVQIFNDTKTGIPLAIMEQLFDWTKNCRRERDCSQVLQSRRCEIISIGRMLLKETASRYFRGDIRVCGDERTCLDGADVISTCTNGDVHIFQPEWFREPRNVKRAR